MSADLCSRCGRPLRDGVCPVGHPQRAARRRHHSRRRRRPWKGIIIFVLLLLLVAGAAYAGLVWYPPEAAGDAMRPLSAQLADTVPPFRSTVDAFPEDASTEALETASAVLTTSDDARTELTQLQTRLETTTVRTIPVVSDQPPMEIARDLHVRMTSFTTNALEAVGDLEAAARYLSELAAMLPALDNLRAAVGNPRSPGEVEGSVAASRPIADQLTADLRSLTPPAEMTETHATLLAIARGISTSIDELEQAGTGQTGPVIRAIVEDIRSQLQSFAEAAAQAPTDARRAGLRDQVEATEAQLAQIVAGLRQLRAEGVEGLTIPQT